MASDSCTAADSFELLIWGGLAPPIEGSSQGLCHIPALSKQGGRSLEVLRPVPGSNGANNGNEAWCRITLTREPAAASLPMGLRKKVVIPRLTATTDKGCMDELVSWELHCDMCHFTATEQSPDQILASTLIQHEPLAMQQHSQMNAGSIGNTLSKAKA